MVICPFSKTSMSFDWDYYSFPLPSRDNRVSWHAETNYGHPLPLPSRENQVCWHAKTNYGHPPPLPSRDKRVRWHAETNYGHLLPLPSRDNQVRWHAETNYGHLLSLFLRLLQSLFVFQRQESQLACGDKLWSSVFIAFKTNYSLFFLPKTIESVGMRRQSTSSALYLF